jgi:hypothetical protein
MLIIIIFGIIINISYTIIPFFTGDRSISAVLHGNQDENTSLIANNGDGEIKMYIDGESVIQERKNL